MYLLGNEHNIGDDWSRRLVKQEKDAAHEDEPSFDNRCVFIQLEDIQDNIKYNFLPKLAQCCQQSKINPIQVTSLENNIKFQEEFCRAEDLYEFRRIRVTGEFITWIKQQMEDYKNKEV